MKKFINEFKAFISRGNIVDMAVGVIIGSAFSTIVTALTDKIIMPFINLLLSLGGSNGLEKAYTFLRPVKDAEGNIDLAKSIYIDWGAFITAIINFFLIALVLFLIMKAINKANKLLKDTVEEATNKDLLEEKHAVRKQAKLDKKKFKVAWAEHVAEKERLAEIASTQPKVETSEDILKDIRDLLSNQNKDTNA